jgi:hypothetical protein
MNDLGVQNFLQVPAAAERLKAGFVLYLQSGFGFQGESRYAKLQVTQPLMERLLEVANLCRVHELESGVVQYPNACIAGDASTPKAPTEDWGLRIHENRFAIVNPGYQASAEAMSTISADFDEMLDIMASGQRVDEQSNELAMVWVGAHLVIARDDEWELAWLLEHIAGAEPEFAAALRHQVIEGVLAAAPAAPASQSAEPAPTRRRPRI